MGALAGDTVRVRVNDINPNLTQPNLKSEEEKTEREIPDRCACAKTTAW